MMPGKGATSPDWLLDEIDSAGRENLDADHVTTYDKKEDAEAARELQLLKKMGLTSQSLVVDMGAGTGQFTLAAASECDRVIAVDISPVMLEVLQAKIDESDLSNVDIVRSGFLTYQHQDRRADFAYSRYALHHLPDFWKAVALRRIRNILQPGGVFRLWDAVYHFEPAEAADRIENWCSSVESSGEVQWNRADIEVHVREEHSTFTWLLEPMLERCNFTIEEATYSPDGFFAKYIARAT